MPTTTTTYADLNTQVASDAARLATDQAAKASLDATYAGASQAAAAALAADQTTLAADTAARDAAFKSAASLIVHDNADGSYVVYESDVNGVVVGKPGISDATALPAPPPPSA